MLEWNGCWEDRGDRIICRWMVSWVRIGDFIAGCIGGYSGGGCFQLEKFVKATDDFHIEANSDFSESFSPQVIQAAEDCQDYVMSFHEEEAWIDAENLLLLKVKIHDLMREKDLLSGGAVLPPDFNALFEKIGLISSLKS